MLFGIDCSISGKRWLRKPIDQRMALLLSQRFDLPSIIGELLAERGVDVEDVERYLTPKISELLSDPFQLVDMDSAIERLKRAITTKEKIWVFGDYDVDGATSAAVLYRFFRDIGTKINFYIPDRLKEGYGPTVSAIDKIMSDGAEVMITVDCGTTAVEALAHAKKNGLDVIVLDHHVAESALPTTTSLVNPNRVDDQSHYSYLAAVGVTFVTIVALNRELRDSGVYDNIGFREPDLFQYLDLVALGTVADVVPLKGLNRAFVQQGLKVLKMRHNIGLRELTEICGIDEEPNSYHLGFVLGPRINAGGRVGDALLGTKLLCTEEVSAARDIATRLDGYNKERQQIESSVLNEALQIASKKQTSSLILTVGEDWHPGVIGIVASRLKEHFGKPALVLAKKSTHESVGSGRSIPGIDLGSLVIKARQGGILSAGGGHSMAAGFTVENNKISELENFMDVHISQLIEDNKIVPTAKVDGVLSLQAASNSLITDINKLGPFGSGNSEPRFGFESIRIGRSMVVGQNHVKCYLSGLDGSSLSAIAFNCVDTKLGENLLNHSNLPLHVIGRLKLNSWQGKTNPQLLIDDAAEAR